MTDGRGALGRAAGGVEPFLASLRRRAARTPRRIGFPEALETRTARAIDRLASEGLLRPVVFGDGARLRERFGAAARVERVAVAEEEALPAAAAWLAEGALDGVVAGALAATSDVIRAGLRQVGLAPGIVTVSSAFYMVLRRPAPGGASVLTFTDPAVVPRPTPPQLAESAELACRARRHIVGDESRVAFLSYATRGSAVGEEVERVREGLRLFRERAPAFVADGELQLDAALVPEVAERKAPGSPVAGRANLLVFPDLNAGNIAYKLLERLAGARALGPVLQGLSRPLNDLSRGTEAEDIVHVACITALMAGPAPGPDPNGSPGLERRTERARNG